MERIVAHPHSLQPSPPSRCSLYFHPPREKNVLSVHREPGDKPGFYTHHRVLAIEVFAQLCCWCTVRAVCDSIVVLTRIRALLLGRDGKCMMELRSYL